MKIIVAGLPKTGTKTLNAALTMLGYNVYDWMENFGYLGDDWAKQYREGFRVEDLKRMFHNVDVSMDNPIDFCWEEILEAFPNAKVILNTRDDDRWYKSIVNQVDQLNNDIGYRIVRTITYSGIKAHYHMAIVARHLAKIWTWPWSTVTLFNEEAVMRVKRIHERNVKLVAPKDQLLVYEVSQGWGPLCDFLGVAIPDVPFPHKNKGGNVMDLHRKENPVMQRMEREFKITVACMFPLLLFLFYLLYKCLFV
uniref:Uncharacterized protein LOC100175117 n=1 Tax=Phallusia mammillata TaxID=59560 RepID=A0A6F9DGX8_9ASCI|nr:uncharacterized protein LOC100175117 [Phallusia mammillata]